MKTDKLRQSNNFEDRRGQGHVGSSDTPFGRQSSSMGSNLLLSLLFSRMGWKGKLLLVLFLLLFGGGGFGNLFGNSASYSPYQSTQVSTNRTNLTDADSEFVRKVLANTEDFWTQEFARHGITYQPPSLVFYEGQTQTACGLGQETAGPFYWSGDEKIYLDMSFYEELTTKYLVQGDFAMAYVIAHEVGHHVQHELGTMTQYAQAKRGMSEKQANALTVRLELQADYYARSWAKHVDGQGYLDVGDIEEAMNAAHAIGDAPPPTWGLWPSGPWQLYTRHFWVT